MMEEVALEPRSTQNEFKTRIYNFFERALSRGKIPLGQQAEKFDVDRKTIDTVLIHHTSQPPGLSAARLSAIELIRLYAPHFAELPSTRDTSLKGHPIYSGHVRNGIQMFWPYHWIIRTDGRAERLLRDDEVGWHAGDWDVNCRSIAIALDNDYEHGCPGQIELRAVAQIIGERYPQVSPDCVLGHREVNPRTSCPSEKFLNSNGNGWKAELLSVLMKFKRDSKSSLNSAA